MTAILLVAVLFLATAPGYAKSSSGTPYGTEVATTIVGFNDLTPFITNPSFEANVVGDGQSVAGASGWTISTGANKAFTWNPSEAQIAARWRQRPADAHVALW